MSFLNGMFIQILVSLVRLWNNIFSKAEPIEILGKIVEKENVYNFI